MTLPQLKARIADLIRYGHFCWVSVNVDEDTTGLEGEMKGADEKLRNVADDALTVARAKRGVPLRRFGMWLKRIERDAKAAFSGETGAVAYKRILPQSASKTLRMSFADRQKAFVDTLAALGHAETPKVLAAKQKEGHGWVIKLTAAGNEVESALATRREAVLGIQHARTEWFSALKGLVGALQQKFKSDRERIDSYFPEVAKEKAEVGRRRPRRSMTVGGKRGFDGVYGLGEWARHGIKP